MSIKFVTSKAQKAREVLAIMGDAVTVHEHDLVEIQHFDIVEVVKAKALAAYTLCQVPVLVEDVGFYVNALGGFPGPYVRSWQQEVGFDRAVLIAEAMGDVSASATCAVGYCAGPDLAILYAEHTVQGMIRPRCGASDFGFDPYFVPSGSHQTYAEMGSERKNACSHRYYGWLNMRDLLQKQGIL